MEEVKRECPELLRWARTCYKEQSHLCLSSQQGVQQGDPLGPLFFCLAWVVRLWAPELAFNLWYLDDGHLVGTWAQLELSLAIIQAEGAKLGVALNTKKCQVWGPGVPDSPFVATAGLQLHRTWGHRA